MFEIRSKNGTNREAPFLHVKVFQIYKFPFFFLNMMAIWGTKKNRGKTQEVSPLTFSWGRLTQGSTTQECFTCQVIDPCWIRVLVASNLVVRAGTANELVLTQTSWSDPPKKNARNQRLKINVDAKEKKRGVSKLGVFRCIPIGSLLFKTTSDCTG